MIPSVGRIVHFCAVEGEDPWAAIITAVRLRPDATQLLGAMPEPEDEVDLTMFPPTGRGVSVQSWYAAPFSSDYKAKHWSWPPRT